MPGLPGLALLIVSLGVLLVASLLCWWLLRPNRARVDPALEYEAWDAVADGRHNSNTDLLWWRDGFLLVHAASPYHMGTTESKLVLRFSTDARRFETLAELRVPGRDIRDPKLAMIDGRLFLYALTNQGFVAAPGRTVLAESQDGRRWTSFRPVAPDGWLFWRPKTRDGDTWYVPAYWHGHGRSVLLRSRDGRAWEIVSEIHAGAGDDETAIEFLPDGRMLATVRLEITPDAVLGNADAGTFVAVAPPPYQRWSGVTSRVTRLDGPALFAYRGHVLALARHQPGARRPFTRLGSSLSRKRTALYRVEAGRGLVHLTDLPSAGDTAYAGAVVLGDVLTASYYTSDTRRDYPWILGMLLATDVRIARISLPTLLALNGGAGAR